MTGAYGTTTTNPALDALGDRLQAAATTAVASGGVPPRRPWAKVAVVPLVALFVVAGVVIANVVPGSSGDTADAAIISAARHTSERATGRFTATVEADGLALGGSGAVQVTTTGAYDADQGLYQASLDASQVLAALPGAEQLGEVGPTIDAVVAGEVVYLDVSPIASVVGAEWLKVTVPELAGEQGLSSIVDPAAVLDALEGAGADMEEAGTEVVRGVETTHYVGTISLQEAYDALPVDERADLDGLLGGVVDLAALPDLPTEVWVDGDGYVRRAQLSLDTSALRVPGLEQAASITVSVELYDIGEEIAVELPEEADAVTVDELVPDDVLDPFDSLVDDLLGPDGPEGLEGFEGLDDLQALLDDLQAGELDLQALLDELEALTGELDLGGLLDDLEEQFGGLLPEPGTPPGGPAPLDPADPPTTIGG